MSEAKTFIVVITEISTDDYAIGSENASSIRVKSNNLFTHRCIGLRCP